MDDDLMVRLRSYADDPIPLPDKNDLVWTKAGAHMLREVLIDMCNKMGAAATALEARDNEIARHTSDIDLLIIMIDRVSECTNEGLEGDDAVIFEQIKRDRKNAVLADKEPGDD